MPSVRIDDLRRICAALLEKKGTPADTAGAVADCVIENCLCGHDTHGMGLIPRFLTDIEVGKIVPDARTEVVKRSGAIALIDGHRGFGQITIRDAMSTAMEVAKKSGVAAVTVTNCNHVGILWPSAQTPAARGMIAMIWCVSGPERGGGLVAPPGGARAAIGANPIAVGIPAGEMKPVVLDMSTSAASGGKVILHAQQGRKIPPGWLLDEHGNPTTDPNELLKDGKLVGSLLPAGGYKGFGLGLAAEIVGGILTGYGASHMSDYREGQGALVVVIDVEAFIPLDEFRGQTDALLRFIKATPTDAETEEILIPGEPEYRAREEQERDGRIPITDAVWESIRTWAERLDVETAVAQQESPRPWPPGGSRR